MFFEQDEDEDEDEQAKTMNDLRVERYSDIEGCRAAVRLLVLLTDDRLKYRA